MRGYGAPLSPSEEVTENLTNPDWGWGDPTPDVQWTEYTLDYGYGSAHGPAAPAYVGFDYTRVADDGGYAILIFGVWPRLGASPRQRPTGFRVYMVDGLGNEHVCYSGRAGQGELCSTDYGGRRLSAYTPQLPVGNYTARVKWLQNEIDVGTISVYRRTRTEEEYALRMAVPSAMDTGPKALQYDSLLVSSAPAADQEAHTTLSTMLRVWGQSIADLKASGIVTRLTQDLDPSDTTINVESTLGMSTGGAVRIGTAVLQYSGTTSTTLTGVTRLYGQTLTLPKGTQVTHDPHFIAD